MWHKESGNIITTQSCAPGHSRMRWTRAVEIGNQTPWPYLLGLTKQGRNIMRNNFCSKVFSLILNRNQTMTKTRTRSKVKQSAMVWKLRCWTQRFFLTHFSDLYSTMWVMLLLTFKLPWSLRRCLGLGTRNAIATMRNMQISSHQFIVYQFINL